MERYPDQIWMAPRLLDFVDINNFNELRAILIYLSWACISLGFEIFTSTTATDHLEYLPNLRFICRVGNQNID